MRLTSVRQRESPQTQVAGRVGDASKTVFDRVDCLMDEDLPKVELQTEVVKCYRNNFFPNTSIIILRYK